MFKHTHMQTSLMCIWNKIKVSSLSTYLDDECHFEKNNTSEECLNFDYCDYGQEIKYRVLSAEFWMFWVNLEKPLEAIHSPAPYTRTIWSKVQGNWYPISLDCNLFSCIRKVMKKKLIPSWLYVCNRKRAIIRKTREGERGGEDDLVWYTTHH